MKITQITVGGSRSLSTKGENSRLDSVKCELTAEFKTDNKEELQKGEKSLWKKLESILDKQEELINERQRKLQPAKLPETKEEAKQIDYEGEKIGSLGFDKLEDIVQLCGNDTPEGRGARILLNLHNPQSGQSAPAPSQNEKFPWDSGEEAPFGTRKWAEQQRVPSETWIRDKKYGNVLKSANKKELNFIAYKADKANSELKRAARILLEDE